MPDSGSSNSPTESALAIDGGEPVLKPPYPVWPLPDEEIGDILQRAWSDGSWGRYEGPHHERLVEVLAGLHQLQYVLPCSSGTFAVELALRGLQIGPDDEVMLAGYDFSGNFRAIEAVGARPVLVDISPASWCLDVALVEESLSPQTRAVIVSHLHGGIADMRRLREIADHRGLCIVEDACQAHAATIQGKVAGTWGDVGVLSFGGSKLITAGRGGALLTNREDIFQRAKIFCERGNNAFPLSELQAAVIPPQVAKLAARNARRAESVKRLCAQLQDPGPLSPVAQNVADSSPCFYKLAFDYDASRCGEWTRDQFVAAVQAEGVPLDAGFRGFMRRGPGRCRPAGTLENSRRAASATLVLHHPILLEDAATIDLLAGAIQKVIRCAHSSR